VSLIGLGAGAEFDGIGVKVYKASNVVLRNLKIHNVLAGDKDAISIEGPADHVWVDHCELYAQYQGVDKDYYDGLLDAKAESEYITYSWNYLHDSWKMMLVGSSETDTFDRKLTAHHNRFENVNSRLPLFRGGHGHIFNNLYSGIESTAVNSRLGACLLVENNVFNDVLNPWVSAYSDTLGSGEVSCNLLTGTTSFMYSDDTFELPTCDASVPYNYQNVLNHPSSVEALVKANAGVGKLSDPTVF
jgi:pectate lyase